MLFPANVTILPELPHMDHLNIPFNSMEDFLFYPKPKQSAPATRLFGHTFIWWDPHVSYSFTNIKLSHLHRRFGHSSSRK